MARVFRQQYTKPIPADAQRTTVKDKKGNDVPAVRFRGSDGKWVVAPIVSKGKGAGTHCRVKSPTWSGRVNGVPVSLCRNKEASEVMLAEKIKKAARTEAGMVDPFEEHGKRKLSEHLNDFADHLRAKGNTAKHVGQVVGCCRALFDGAGFTYPADLDLDRASAWLMSIQERGEATELPAGQQEWTPAETAALLGIVPRALAAAIRRHGLATNGMDGKARRFPRETVEALLDRAARGASPQTVNHYIAAVRSFCRWMVKPPRRRMALNPLDGMELLDIHSDRRHDRRELTADEIRLLLSAARQSDQSFRGLDGVHRFHLYACACGTGFRAAALGSLTPKAFDLAGDRPTVTLAARFNKSRRTKVQPLPADVAALLRDFLTGKPAGLPVWGGSWARDKLGAEMLRRDLAVAGIPYAIDGPDGPLYADFHALRHSYLTLGGRAGIDLRMLQELAGHSTPELTVRYTHVRLHDQAGAVEKLPSFLPAEEPRTGQHQALKATGTDGPVADNRDSIPASAYTALTHGPDGGQGRERETDGSDPKRRTVDAHHNPFQGKESGGDEGGVRETGGGDGKNAAMQTDPLLRRMTLPVGLRGR